MKRLFVIYVLLVAITSSSSIARAQDSIFELTGEPAPDVSVQGSDGKTYSLSELKGKIVVLEWYNHHCPTVNLRYDRKMLQSLQSEYREKGVEWFTVVSAAEGKLGFLDIEGAEQVREQNGIRSTAILMDKDGLLAHEFRVEKIPNVAIINAEGNIVYLGALDKLNEYRDDKGVLIVEQQRNYVAEVLDALLEGKPVPMVYNIPVGCQIKR